MVRQKIINLIEKAIKQSPFDKELEKFEIPEILIETQQNSKFGDYSSNIALQISKILKKNPMEVAEIINNRLSIIIDNKLSIIEKIEIAKPGFINFFISKEYLQKQVADILKQGEKFGDLKTGAKKSINIEFISGNPTGQLHIGQGRGAFFGDCLANVLRKAGYKVIREYFINDAQNSNQIKELGKTALGKGEVYLDEYLKTKIENQKAEIKKCKSESEAGSLLAQEVQKDNKNFIEKKLKIKFDNWVSEENLHKKNKIKETYDWLEKKGLICEIIDGAKSLLKNLEKSKNSEGINSTCTDKLSYGSSGSSGKFGYDWEVDNNESHGVSTDTNWLLKRATGEPTYFLTDIAYHKDKFDKKFDKVIDIWGADHQGHIPRMKYVAGKILNYKGVFDILICQVVRLKSGLKLSKRKGQIVTLEELIDEVGLDVARFFYLSKSLDTQMEFDMGLAKEQSQKNPVFYVQYAYARINSILRKAHSNQSSIINYQLLKHPSELNLIKQIMEFSEIVEDTAKDYQIQRIPKYAMDLATTFHQFYRDCQVITDDKNLTDVRIALISITQITLKNTLDLMGISAPEKM